jgi:soluble lytic murein transglycosylase-like protein
MSKSDQGYKATAQWVLKYKTEILRASASTGIPPEVLAAIMSRESGGGLYLKPKGPSGTGDSGHGRGLMQIDDRSHSFARGSQWKDPQANINYGAKLLADYKTAAIQKGVFAGDALKVALAGYNCGIGRAVSSYKSTKNPDKYTTGHDYSADVLARSRLFARDFGGALTASGSGGALKLAIIAALGVAAWHFRII